jgi:hypothetical protein
VADRASGHPVSRTTNAIPIASTAGPQLQAPADPLELDAVGLPQLLPECPPDVEHDRPPFRHLNPEMSCAAAFWSPGPLARGDLVELGAPDDMPASFVGVRQRYLLVRERAQGVRELATLGRREPEKERAKGRSKDINHRQFLRS